MIDGHDRAARIRIEEEGDGSVETLASRALTELAANRVTAASMMSERFIRDLTAAAMQIEPGHRKAVIHDMLESRIRREDIVDFYIPEAARRLGDAWCTDGVSFAEVTIGVARLQGVLRDIASEWIDDRSFDGDAPGVMIVVADNDFHTLGSMILSTQLRRMGISVKMVVGQCESDLLATVADGHFDAILISAALGERLAPLKKLVEKIRAASVRPTPVVIGGSAVGRTDDIKTKTSADHATTDPREALRLCGLKISAPGARRRATSE